MVLLALDVEQIYYRHTPDYSIFEFFWCMIKYRNLGYHLLNGIQCRHAIGVCCDEHRLGSEEPYPKDVVQGSARVKIHWK
jgi:hypothetical protein